MGDGKKFLSFVFGLLSPLNSQLSPQACGIIMTIRSLRRSQAAMIKSFMQKNKNKLILFSASFLVLLLSAFPNSVLAADLTDAQCSNTYAGTCKARPQGSSVFCNTTTETDNGSCTLAGFTLVQRHCCSLKSASVPPVTPPQPVESFPADRKNLTGTACQSITPGAYCGASGALCRGTPLGTCTGPSDSIGYCCPPTPGSPGAQILPPSGGTPTQTNTGASPNSRQYILLEKIPGTEGLVNSDLKAYLEAIYRLALILVTLSAVFMLSVGGFMYLTSAGNTSRLESAKGVIFDSLIGLVIALVAWLVLYVINPDLANPRVPTISGSPTVTPGTPPPGTGVPGTCGGFNPQSGIKCEDAAPALSDLLACIKGKGVNTTVSSIGDSAGFLTCKNNWKSGTCAHKATSCHYGGGVTKTAPECQKSQAADLSIKNSNGTVDMSIARAIMDATTACKGIFVNESGRPGAPHIHVSVKNPCCSDL